jgi:hypothetical protein
MVRRTQNIMRKEYRQVRNRTDCIARETDFFQEFRRFDRRFVRAMLKPCWFSELRRSDLTKALYVAVEEDGKRLLRGVETRIYSSFVAYAHAQKVFLCTRLFFLKIWTNSFIVDLNNFVFFLKTIFP